ncbi:MAG: hypothetical protein FWD71_02730 [Oscillospiraceae bacterium]|nr:hypothetical protein [Oscillospiraceae bacterium]
MNKNNKTIRKSILFLLISTLLLFTLLSCSNNTKEKQNANSGTDSKTDTAENTAETTKLTDGLPNTDMQGYVFNIFNFDNTWFTWANTRILAEEENGDIVNDALYKRERQIEDRFNCSFKTNEVNDTTDYIKRNVSAGDNTYQLYSIYDQNFGVLVPYMLDCNTLPYLKLGEKYWNPDATSIYNFSGKQLALAGNISLSVVSTATCIVFNKKIYQQYVGGDSLYDCVRNNQWTIDKYFQIAESAGKDLNGDGQWTADDLYGINSNFKGLIGVFLKGVGMGFTTPGDDGVPVFNLAQNESALNLVTKLMDALSIPGYYYNTATTVYDATPDMFTPGHALFSIASGNGIDVLRAMPDDIGIIPLPKLSETQDRYYATSFGNTIWVVPKTVDVSSEGDNIGMILEAMSFSGYYDIIPQYKEIVLKTKSARDDESADMLDIIFNSVKFDFDMNVLFDAELQTTILPAMWKDKTSGNLVSICEKNTAAITNYITKFYKAVDAVE